MIFKTITDESTGAVKSVGLFGKTLNELKSSFANIKINGLLNSIFKTSSIDTKAIDSYNKAIIEATKNNVSMADKQQIMQTAMEGTNKETARLIKSTQGNIVKQKQLKAAQDATTLSAKASQVAIKGLSMALNIIAMFAISEVIGEVINYLDELSHKAQNIADEAKSRFSESNEKNEEYKENIKSLDEYKQKYQEILNSNDSEINKRKSLLELQGNINKLVGTQCDGLDLVNGKLDDQISKIEKITKGQKEQYYQNSVGNYTNAKSAANSSTGQVDDNVTKVYSESNPDKELVKILQENGYGNLYNSSSGNFFADLFSFGNSGGSINIDDGIDAYGNILTSLEDRVANLKKLQNVLLKNGKGDSGLYGAITSQIQTWEDSLKKQKSAAEDVIKSYIDLNANPEKINSVDDYKKYINTFTGEIKKDKNVSQIIKDGVLNDEDIKTIVNDYISVLDGFSEWYDKWKNNNNESDKTAISSQKTFDEVWNSIGEGDDDASKKAQEAKEKVLELAEAGKLTIKEFKDSSIADTLKQAGFSAEEATKKVNALVEETKQLSALRTGITSITSAYDEKKESKDNRVSSNTLSSLYDTLDVEKWTDKSDLKVWEQYKDIASDSASSLKQMKEAQDNLATSFVNSNNFLSNLNESNANYYRNLLNEMGVVNGNRVVQNLLGREKAISAIETQNLTNMTGEEINQLINEKGKTEDARIAMREFALEKVYANGQALDTTADIQQLINLIDAFGETSAAIKRYRDYMNGDYNTTAPGGMNVDYLRKEAEKDATSAIKNLKNKQKIKIKTTGSNKADVKRDSGGGKKDSGAKTKKSKQVIDWIERRLKNLQNTIDYTSSKLQNLFTVKSKNSNLDKQIKTTTKLINEYGIAAEKYQQKANKVAKASTKTVKGKKGKKKKVKTNGLSKDVISKIKTGKLTKKTKLSSLIKEYGEDTANKIQSYIDYYDKAQEAKKNKQDQIAKKRELQVQKQTNIQEEADKKSARYQAERELAQLKDKNGWIKKEIDSTEESYDAQIKAAEIQKDTAEKEKLIAEKKKALLALYQEEVDNIKANSEARIQSLENGVVNNNGTRRSYGQKYYQNQVALAEARGNKVNKDWYRQQSSIENKKISEYTAERNQLIKELAKFTEGTTEWYNLQADIQACDDSINEARIAQAENTKAMRELTEKMEQEYDDWFSNLNNEISFISSLASGDMTDSDKGTFTDAGNLAIYSQSLLFQSSNAEKEYWKTQTNKLQKLIETNASVAQIQAAGFEFNSIEDANDALTSYRQNWQDAIKEEKQAEEEIINLMKEKYEAEKDYLQDIVDARKESLNLEKDLYDYERNIAEKTKNVATLQKRINSIRNDNSEEGRARLSKLQVELDSAQSSLANEEYDRYISEQQNMLDNMMSQYEDLMTKLQKNTDKILSDGFYYVNENIGSLTTLFQERAKAYDYQMSTDLSTINQKLNDGSLEIISKNSDIAQLLAGESGASENNVISLLRGMGDSIIKSYDDYKAKQNTPPPTPTNNNGGSGGGKNNNITSNSSYITTQAPGANNVMKDIDGKTAWGNIIHTTGKSWGDSLKGWLKNQATGKKKAKVKKDSNANNYSSDLNKKLAEKYGYVLSDKNGGLAALAEWLNITKSDKNWTSSGNVYKELQALGCFKTGGIAQLVKSNGEDGLMMARNGEGFVSPENVQDIKDLMKVVPDMNKFISSVTETPNIPITRNNQPSNSIGEVLFNIDVNPKDFPDFVSQLQNEKRVQQVFSVAVNDLTQKGKITNNIQRY